MAVSGSEHNPIEAPSDDEMDTDETEHVEKIAQPVSSKLDTSMPKTEVEGDSPKAARSHTIKNDSDAEWELRVSTLENGGSKLAQMLREERQLHTETKNELSVTELKAELNVRTLSEELAKCKQNSILRENDWNVQKEALEANVKEAKEERDIARRKVDTLEREKSREKIRYRTRYLHKAGKLAELEREFVAQKQQLDAAKETSRKLQEELDSAMETTDAIQELLDEERRTNKARQERIDQLHANLKQFTDLAASMSSVPPPPPLDELQ